MEALLARIPLSQVVCSGSRAPCCVSFQASVQPPMCSCEAERSRWREQPVTRQLLAVMKGLCRLVAGGRGKSQRGSN
ncbi:hypothetical protein E2C01_065392 [Portunus trituberculatus]|uniref:Uncharacterized protein n=1 Tax=Portunus trituberculatus TaxID=210409 RepID=A0A5B7HLS7_PORTR|nr:hypothetical protein [Portunus trituberculatus]